MPGTSHVWTVSDVRQRAMSTAAPIAGNGDRIGSVLVGDDPEPSAPRHLGTDRIWGFRGISGVEHGSHQGRLQDIEGYILVLVELVSSGFSTPLILMSQ